MPELYTVKGYNRVANNLRALASKYKDELDEAIREFTERQTRRLRGKHYPPERPGQKYQRTFTLRRSWTAERHWPSDWAVVNEAPYAHWVVSDDMQAWMHVGRWWTVPDIIEDEISNLTSDLASRLVDLAGG